jgi:FkbM family methyltransferase
MLYQQNEIFCGVYLVFNINGLRAKIVYSLSKRHLKNSPEFTGHHPIFKEFNPFKGEVATNYQVDYIGACTGTDMFPNCPPRDNKLVIQDIPPVDEEYFEWIDTLVSVKDAEGSYCMLELGAGYGRWAVRAYMAARQKGIPKIKIGMIEAEPAHLIDLEQHLLNNNISPNEYQIHDCAISTINGKSYFYVGSPDNFGDKVTKSWYGQSLVQNYETKNNEKDGILYYGHPVIELKSGWMAIEVDKKDIRELLDDYGLIDFMDMDVQGEELAIIDAAIDQINKQVKRLHIGTHNEKIESNLRKTLNANGWLCLRDYSLGRINATPYGPVSFVDGVQSWINSRFKVSML